ncbi:MAG TPA: hypothetical protein VFV99_31900 [Kofleriaceae bacterium]|nr:hypothetical protein [Kofleriaceae bacterium]
MFGASDPEDEVEKTWEVVAGTGKYAAIWDYDPAGDSAYQVAPIISRAVRGTVYVAQLHKHLYGVSAYKGGRALDDVVEAPLRLANRLGVPFPPSPVVSPEAEWSVCIVDGAPPDLVNSALDLTPEDRVVVRVDPHPLGTIIYASDRSPVLGVPSMVKGRGLEHATTYAVERSHGDALTIWVYRKGEIILYFCTDERLGLGPPNADRTWDIKGARDVDAILAALSIPPALLGW